MADFKFKLKSESNSGAGIKKLFTDINSRPSQILAGKAKSLPLEWGPVYVTAINFILPLNVSLNVSSNLPNIREGPNTYLPFIEQGETEYR